MAAQGGPMKAVLLAGGYGTRLSEESYMKPKPMIEIGGMPILWHIMKIYSHYGINDFVICCGYKQHMIKQFFAEYYLHRSDVTFDFSANNAMEVHTNFTEPWRVTLVDTGLDTMTGGRIKRVQPYVSGETFCLTYGDGVADVNIGELIAFHKAHGKTATLTAINVGQRFGVLDISPEGSIEAFREKNMGDGGVVNGGFMVMEPEIFAYIEGDDTVFEKGPLETVADQGQLMAYRHGGFWQCMDTQRDLQKLQELWQSGNAPWRCW